MHQIAFDWVDGATDPATLMMLSTSNTAINTLSALINESKVRKISISDEMFGDGVLLYFMPDLENPGIYIAEMGFEDCCGYNSPKENSTVSDTVVELIPNIKQEYIHNFKCSMQGAENTLFTTYTFIENSLSTLGGFGSTSALLEIFMSDPSQGAGKLIYAGSTSSLFGTAGYYDPIPLTDTDYLVDEAVIPTKPEMPSYTYSDIGKYLTPTNTGFAWRAPTGGPIAVSASELSQLLSDYISKTLTLNPAQEYYAVFTESSAVSLSDYLDDVFTAVGYNNLNSIFRTEVPACGVLITLNDIPVCEYYDSQNQITQLVAAKPITSDGINFTLQDVASLYLSSQELYGSKPTGGCLMIKIKFIGYYEGE